MTHLSASEFVDLVEGTLDATRAAHVATCGACREQADALRLTLRDTSSAGVPEPSPLFWDHFSARVRNAIADAPSPGIVWWRRPAVALTCAAVAGVLVLVTLRAVPQRSQPGLPLPAAPALASTDQGPLDVADTATSLANDAVWTLLRSAASEIELDEAHAAGLDVRPGSIEKAVLELTPVERTELERLLRDELRRAGA